MHRAPIPGAVYRHTTPRRPGIVQAAWLWRSDVMNRLDSTGEAHDRSPLSSSFHFVLPLRMMQ